MQLELLKCIAESGLSACMQDGSGVAGTAAPVAEAGTKGRSLCSYPESDGSTQAMARRYAARSVSASSNCQCCTLTASKRAVSCMALQPFTLECVDLAANGKLQACDGWLSLLFDLHKRDWLHIAARMLSPLFWQLTHCGQPYCLLVLLFTCSSTMTAA